MKLKRRSLVPPTYLPRTVLIFCFNFKTNSRFLFNIVQFVNNSYAVPEFKEVVARCTEVAYTALLRFELNYHTENELAKSNI